MDMFTLMTKAASNISLTVTSMLESQTEKIVEISNLFTMTLKNGGTVFWCGNGGSSSESSHLATELIGRYKSNRRSLPSISLSADTTAITCIANDFGYDEIFSRQLSGLGRPGDLLIVLSTSGQSPNIVKVLKTAKYMGIKSVALLGKGGGLSKNLADLEVIVPSQETARIQEIQLMLGHSLCEIAEINLGIA